MNDEVITTKIAILFASEAWWKPVFGFMSTNCGKFSADSCSNEEYDCFVDFRKLVENLIDSYICKQIGVRPQQFENAIYEQYFVNNPRAVSIVDMLQNMMDFMKLKEQMIAQNEKIEEETTNAMLSFHNLDETQSKSDENAAMDIATLLEKAEEQSLVSQTKKMCEDMKKVFNLSDEDIDNRAPLPSPRVIQSNSFSSRKSNNVTPIIPSVSYNTPVVLGKIPKTTSTKMSRPLILKPAIGSK